MCGGGGGVYSEFCGNAFGLMVLFSFYRITYTLSFSICGQDCYALSGLISAGQRNEAELDSNEE